jgi:hypothetical protein
MIAIHDTPPQKAWNELDEARTTSSGEGRKNAVFLYLLVIHELAHVHTSLKNSWRPSLQTENAHVSRDLKKVAPLRVIAI